MSQVAIIIGTSSGLGLATARYLIGRGFTVYGGSRTESPLQHENFIDLEIDVTHKNQIQNFIKEVSADFQGVDLFMNTAAVCEMSSIAETEAKDIENHFKTNIESHFNFLKSMEELIIPGQTQFINLLSISAKTIFENTLSYTLTEYAKLAMIKTFEKEWKEHDVVFNNFFLGAVDTPLWDDYPEVERHNMLSIPDVLYYLKTVIEAPHHTKLHDLTLTHRSGFIE